MARQKKIVYRTQEYDIGNDVTVKVTYPDGARPRMFHNDTQVIVGVAPRGSLASSIVLPDEVDAPELAERRRALQERHPDGPSGTPRSSGAVTPTDLGFPPLTPEALGGGGAFTGISNEDDDPS